MKIFFIQTKYEIIWHSVHKVAEFTGGRDSLLDGEFIVNIKTFGNSDGGVKCKT
jgi:hypothetical protein